MPSAVLLMGTFNPTPDEQTNVITIALEVLIMQIHLLHFAIGNEPDVEFWKAVLPKENVRTTLSVDGQSIDRLLTSASNMATTQALFGGDPSVTEAVKKTSLFDTGEGTIEFLALTFRPYSFSHDL